MKSTAPFGIPTGVLSLCLSLILLAPAAEGEPDARADSTAPVPTEAGPPLLAVEVIHDTLPIYAVSPRSTVRDPVPDDVFDPMRVLLSRERYWEQDMHLDVVIRLAPPDDEVESEASRLKIVMRDSGGATLGEWEIDPAPSDPFIFYPALPEGFTGEAELELAWTGAEDRELAREQRPFRVEQYEESAPRTGQVTLRVLNAPGAVVENFPVSVGVPFPRGTLADAAHLRLVDENDQEIPLQADVTARWSKFGPVKWVRCDFTIDLEGEPREVYLQYGPEVERSDAPPMEVEVDNGHFAVDTGRLRLDGAGMWWLPEEDGEAVKVLGAEAINGAFVEHEDSRIYRALDGEGNWEVEELGPEKVVLRRAGWYREAEGGEEFCQYISRWILYRDAPVARLFHTWTFTGDGNHDRIRNMGWEFELGEGLEPEGFLNQFGTEGSWLEGEFLLQWDYDHYDVYGTGELEEHAGARAPGVARAGGDGVRLYFGAKDFWQNYPSELEFGEGTLWFHNWPRHNRPAGYRFNGELVTESGEPALPSAARHAQYEEDRLTRSEWKLNAVQARYAHEGEVLDFRLPEEFGEDPIWGSTTARGNRTRSASWELGQVESGTNAQGISRTEEMWLYVAPGDSDDRQGRKILEGLNDETLRGVVDPVWVAASGAFYEMHHQDWEHYPEEERVFELVAHSVGRVAERLGAYGMWIHGDLPAWGPRPSNREPDLYRAYRKAHHGWPFSWKPYARSGDPRLLKYAEAATRQMVDAGYCRYVGEGIEESVGTDRRKGRRNVSVVPWAGKHRLMPAQTRSLHDKCDYLWYAWYLTGYHRAKDNAMDWGALTKIEEPLHRRGPISGPDRPSITLLKSYLEMYEATFDPWFLVAAHALAELHMDHAERRANDLRIWEPGEREFLRFTGDTDFAGFYVRYAKSISSPDRHSTWSRHAPQFPDKAYAWKITGDDFFRRRAVRGVEYGTWIAQDDGAPDFLLGYPAVRDEGTGFTLFASFYLRWFPSGLWAVHAAGTPRPEAIHSTTILGHWTPAGTESDAIIVTLLKSDDEELPMVLQGHRFAREGDLARYTVTGPDGETVLEGTWDIPEALELAIPSNAPPGEYNLEVVYDDVHWPGTRSVLVPVSKVDNPEVMVFPPDQALPTFGEDAPLWFMVPEGVETFWVEVPHKHWTSLWSPDGTRVHSFIRHEPDEFPVRLEVEVPEGWDGKAWRLTLPRHGTRLDPQIPPVFAVDRTRWFMPESLPKTPKESP